MLTIMCPNCRHRFPAPGCCEPSEMQKNLMHPTACYYGGGLLVPRGYTSGGGCFINAPTIVHGPAIIQSGVQQCGSNAAKILDSVESEKFRIHAGKSLSEAKGQPVQKALKEESYQTSPECHITTTCDLTGGSVTITTPSIQSGGCLIQSTDSGILVQAPHIEIRPKLSGGGCLVQKKLSTDDQETVSPILLNEEGMGLSKYKEDGSTNPTDSCCGAMDNHPHQMLLVPPSGCQELPGNRRNAPIRMLEEKHQPNDPGNQRHRFSAFDTSNNIPEESHRLFNKENQEPRQMSVRKSCCCNNVQNVCQNHVKSNTVGLSDNRESLLVDSTNGVQIQVNATVQLPASLGQCTVNITATAGNSEQQTPARTRNNFNGGGLVQPDGISNVSIGNNNSGSNNNTYHNERRDGAPTTPVSWLMPCPWGFDTYLMDKDVARLCEVKRLLQTCGWYHEGLSWQQSESLLKDTPVGRWLMRDSSDSRYTFAVSVQTARGPTSVRVHYFLGRFRLDAEPSLALAMPLFDCPIKMLEHYVEYSKRMDEHRTEVWVDYSGQLYSQIYLTKPLVKEVRSLSHLARLVVHRNKLPTDHLPPLIRNYLAEYPYTL